MCDFFFFFLQPQKNKIQYEFSMWRIFNVAFSRDERGSSCPDDETSDAVIKILWFHM